MSLSDSVCIRKYDAYATLAECCAAGTGAFPAGCSASTAKCWVVGTYYPTQTCQSSANATQCAQNWGQVCAVGVCVRACVQGTQGWGAGG